MSDYDISGTFYNSSATTIETMLRKAFGDVKTKSRLFGYNMEFQSNSLTLDVYTLDDNGSTWCLKAVFNGTRAEREQLLERLTRSLIEADTLYLIDVVELNEDGDPVSDEETLSHPEFDERYVPPE